MTFTHLTAIGTVYILIALICAFHARPKTLLPKLTIDRHIVSEILIGLTYIGSDYVAHSTGKVYVALSGIV